MSRLCSPFAGAHRQRRHPRYHRYRGNHEVPPCRATWSSIPGLISPAFHVSCHGSYGKPSLSCSMFPDCCRPAWLIFPAGPIPPTQRSWRHGPGLSGIELFPHCVRLPDHSFLSSFRTACIRDCGTQPTPHRETRRSAVQAGSHRDPSFRSVSMPIILAASMPGSASGSLLPYPWRQPRYSQTVRLRETSALA